MVRIFLDDLRATPPCFNLTFRTGEELLEYFKIHRDIEVEHISFDHDLGENVISGYEVVKEIVNLNVNIKRITFHTDNIVGFKNMWFYLKNAQRVGVFSNKTIIENTKYNSIDGNFTNTGYSPV